MAIASPSRPKTSPPSEKSYVAATAKAYLDVYGGIVGGLWPAKHHDVWVDKLTALVNGTAAKRKLLLVAPPGTAKSTWISLFFPTWYLGNHPDHSLLFLTTADTMAGQFGGVVKGLLEESGQYRAVFPADAVRPDESRGWSSDGLYLKGAPKLGKDPSYRAVGYGTSTLGSRVHGLIIDDPLAQEDAQNAQLVEKALAFHDMTVDTRLHPNGWEVAIMTRWAQADMAARLMERDDWDAVVMPSTGYWGPGAVLWEDRFSAAWLAGKRGQIGVAKYNCVYECDPTALGGNVFKRADWFRPLPPTFDRAKLMVLQFWDLAFSKMDTADYTAAVTLGVDRDQNLYVLNVWRERVDEESLDNAIAAHMTRTRPQYAAFEEGIFKKAAAVRDLVARLRKKVAVGITIAPITGDKVLNAQLPAGRAQAGMVYADTAAPWFPDFLAECLSFPNGENDDMVDGLSGAAQLALSVVNQPQKTRVSFGG